MKKWILFFLLIAAPAIGAMTTGKVTRMVVYSADGKALDIDVTGWKVLYDPVTYTGVVSCVTVGTNGIITAGRIVANEADIEAKDPYRGLILHATNDTSYVISVGPDGSLFTTQISASPEIPYSNRVQKINQELERKKSPKRVRKEHTANVNISSPGAWVDVSPNLEVSAKCDTNDQIFVSATIYGRANAGQSLGVTLRVEGDDKGDPDFGLGYTLQTSASCMNFTWLSQKLKRKKYDMKLRVRGDGRLLGSKVPIAMDVIVLPAKTQ